MNQETQTEITDVVVIDERRGCTSASNAMYDDLCPGRHLAQRGLSEPESDDAKFGKQIHDALYERNPEGLDAQQLSIYDSCIEIVEKLMEQVFGPDAPSAVQVRERRFWVMVGGKYEHSAKPDLIFRHGPKGLVIEFKTLPGEVEPATKNQQLRDQAVLSSGSLLMSDVYVAVVQPLVTHTPEICHYDKAALQKSELDIFARVTRSNDPNAPRVAGPKQCQYCLARKACPQYLKMVETAAPTRQMAALAAVAVGMWTPDQRVTFLQNKPIAEKWLDECARALKELAKQDPNAIPGYTLEDGSVRSPINNVSALHERLLAIGVKTEELLAIMEVGKKDLELVVRKATNLKGKGLAAKINELLDGITDQKQDAPSLVRSKQ